MSLVPPPAFLPPAQAQEGPTVDVTGSVWVDADGDGIRSDDEAGLEGVALDLVVANEEAVDTATSDANGEYVFEDAAEGIYRVEADLPDGYSVSPQVEPSDHPDESVNIFVASEDDTGSARTDEFGVVAGEETDLNLGLRVEEAEATTSTTVPPEPTSTTTAPDTTTTTTAAETTTTTTPQSTTTTTVPDTTTTTTAPIKGEEIQGLLDPPTISPLSVQPAGTFVQGPNTWYAYVAAGENLDVSFVKAAGGGATDVTITIRGPGGVTDTCVIPDVGGVGTSCVETDLTAATAGVWQIDFQPDLGASDWHEWSIDVQNGTTSIAGRVYAERYSLRQPGGTGGVTEITFWYQSEQGFLYEATYSGYNGINSSFTSDATGLAQINTCLTAYESMEGSGPNNDTGRLWWPAFQSPGQCGDPYKIFFENPDSALPASATLWDGSTVWLQPPVTLPTLTNLAFSPDSTTIRSGEFTFDVSDFTGNVDVLIDVNNDGDYADPVDRTVPAAVTQDGTVAVPFDGLDGQGNPIPATQDLSAGVAITRAGEIHFVNSDVETRAGLEVQALNGPDAGSFTLYWNDTDLDTGRIGTIPSLDGRGGVSSNGGAHGWVCAVGTDPCNGSPGSWGQARRIDDWTYHTIDESVEIDIPGDPLPTFECTGEGMLIQHGGPNLPPTTGTAINMVTGLDSQLFPTIPDYAINAAGYNVQDGYIYGIDRTTSPVRVVRIGSNGEVDVIGTPQDAAGDPLLGAPNIGDMDDQGQLWVATPANGRFYQIDLSDPSSPTYNQIVNQGDVGTWPVGADWAFVPGTNALYSVGPDPVTGDAHLFAFDRTAMAFSDEGLLDGGNAISSGAMYAAPGELYTSNNIGGDIYRIDIDADEAEFFASGPPSGGNDGARCPIAVNIDFGDAPDSYGTLLADDGPRHGIPGYIEAAGTAPLMLGATIDPESDGAPSAAADGDGADEDGVAAPIEMTFGADTTVTVSVTNDTGDNATLAGWIDLDGSGTFEAGELELTTVTTSGDYDLTFDPAATLGNTFARFRLFPGDVAQGDLSPTGPASAGEVEDYPVTPELPPSFPACDPRAFHALNNPSDWYSVDLATGQFSLIEDDIGTGDIRVNAIGYSTVDDRVYGVELELGSQTATGFVVAIGEGGDAIRLGPVQGLVGVTVLNVGDISEDGILYATLSSGTPTTIYAIDVDPSSAGFLTMTSMPRVDGDSDAGNLNLGSDWAFGPDGLLYTLRNSGELVTVDPGGGEIDSLGAVPGVPAGGFGAVFFDADGFFYAYDNDTGGVYRIDLGSRTGVLFSSDGEVVSNNDGARCPDAPLPVDYGDAPDSYGTLLADDGPRHSIPGYDSGTDTAPLMLGDSIDIESDGQPGPDADGDGADEDGVAAPIEMLAGQSTTVTVSATNTSGGPATLVGWIDLDNDGVFEDTEWESIPVPDGSSAVDFDLTFDPATFVGDGTHARFRLFPGTVADPDPTGPAGAGEVEDYTVSGPFPESWACETNEPGLLFQDSSTSELTVNRVDLVTGDYLTPTAIPGYSINATGYNIADGYVYGWDNDAEELVAIGSDGTVVGLDQPDGMTGSQFIGDVDDSGHYWTYAGGTWYDVDLETMTVDSGTLGQPAGVSQGLDWAFIPGTNSLWRVVTSGGQPALLGFNRTSHTWTTPAPLPNMTDGNYGAVFADADGFLYASHNDSGEIWRVDVDAATAEFFSQGEPASGNDGARCFDSQIIIDFGDADDSFGTTLGSSGARHGIQDYDESTGTAPLMLGSSIDSETEGVPTPGSDGDDNADVDDEDAVTGPIEFVAGQPTTVPVTVTNDTGVEATLAAWADLNGNGIFDLAERVIVPVTDAPGTRTVDVLFDGAFPVCQDVRFRLYPGDVADPLPTGPAAAGEVEDHPVVVLPDCTADDIPLTVSGVAQAWTPDSEVQVPSASPASNALNAPDGVGSQLWSAATPPSELTLDLATVVPEGNAVTLHLAQATINWSGPVRVTSSADGVTFGNPVDFTPTAAAPTYEAFDYVAPAGGVRFVRIVPLEVAGVHSAVRVDAVTYSYITCECEDAVNFVDDASFESFAECSFHTGTFGAWTVIEHSAHVWGDNCGQGWDSPDGVNSVDLDGAETGGIQQVIDGLTPGNTYNLTFYMAFNPAAGADSASMRVSIADFDETYTSASNATLGGFNLVHVEFTADSSSELLSFESLTGSNDPTLLDGGGTSGFGVVIDNVRITPKNCDEVPLPYDFGDVPDSYGTTTAASGARHAVPTYDPTTNSAPVMLGVNTIDVEPDGQPTAAADGDDINGVDDDSGVLFNPALGHTTPVLRTGLDPVSLQPVENTLEIEPTADGFVSVWVDWNLDGDFDVAEREFNAEPVVAGPNTLTFPQGTNPNDIRTYVRVRYSTDAASIADPTGPAPDGEVEDYQVLVERLTTPDVCAATDTEYYAFTFSDPVDEVDNDGAIGSRARYENVTVIDGAAVDMVLEVVDGALQPNLAPPNGFGVGGSPATADDALWRIAFDATIRYSFYEAGTTTPVAIDGVFTVNDMDGVPPDQLEIGTFDAADLADYAVSQGSAVTIAETGGNVEFHGNGDQSGGIQSRFQIVLEGISTFDSRWQGAGAVVGSGFLLDGDGDLSIDPPACEDLGDAPASYDTLLADNGPNHTLVPNFFLGSEIDFDPDGQPSPDADGDDTNRLDDEDGVTFNPALNYTTPVLRTGLDPVSLQPVENTLEIEASEDGFVSVWVDWNLDGDFDLAEREFNAEPVVAGTNTLTFPHGTNPDDIRTYVRVRYSTDAASIADPTGPAPDGEVEDYRVLIERLVQPDACVDTGTTEYYAFTFDPPALADLEGTGGPDSSVRFRDVAVVGGVPVDLFIETISGTMNANQAPPNGYGSGDGVTFGLDDARWQVATDAVLRYTFYEAGTDDPMPVNAVFTVNDMDDHGFGRLESATFSAADLASYAVTQGSAVSITETGGNVVFTGHDNSAGAPESRFQVVLEGIDTMDVGWTGFGGSGYGFDGDKDLSIDPPACEDWGDAPDSYDTTAAENGPNHTIVPGLFMGAEIDFDADGQPTPDADGDDTNRLDDEDGVGSPIEVTAGLPTTVDVTVTNTSGEDAVLAGWIDLDGSGTFDAGELEQIPVPDGTTGGSFSLTFDPPTAGGDSYARFRLFPDDGTTPITPTGPAPAGEVEDYTTTFVPGPPIFLGCSALTTFDDGNENWRAATTRNGTQVILPPQPVEWQPTAGNPGGAVIEDDLDGNWTELWTPSLVANGFATDYSFAIGDTLQFDYRNNTGISVDVYVTVAGTNGDFLFYNFRSQITNSTQWNRIRVPMDASQWQTAFNNATGPVGPAPTPAEFGAVLESVDRFAFSIEGQTGADRTAFDNFGSSCDDLGDAPASYDTLLTDGGPVHRAVGLNPATGEADLMLGATIDIENDGFPSAGADGDDSDVTDDEDGVAAPINMAAGSPTTVTVAVTNNTAEQATLAGWIDLDADGTFETGERAMVTVPANTVGDFDLVFPAGTATTNSYARFRLFPGDVTDPLPTGAATAGEVEDYPVSSALVHYEKTVTPDDVAVLQPGDTFTYTVTVSNLGAVPLTTPSFTDDLSGVVGDGDATYNNDATVVSGPGAVSFTPDVISWDLGGDTLDPGEQAVVEYSVTIADPPAGDFILANGVLGTGPGSNCTDDPATDPDCYVEIPQPDIDGVKTSDAVGNVEPGQTITYQFTINNVGPGDALNAVVWDDLSGVLDDAAYNNDAQILAGGPGAVSFDAANQRIVWNGPLDALGGPVDSVTIEYTVTVNDAQSLGDGSVRNALLMTGCPFPPIYDSGDPDYDPECVVVDEVEAWTAVKTSDAQGRVEAGDTVNYEITVENTGNVPLTAADVVNVDDLTDVLDDAAYNNDAADAGHSGAFTFAASTLTWSGALAVGETVTLTYSVTVNEPDALGNGQMLNAITGSSNCPDPAITDPNDPDFDPECVVIEDVVAYTVVKTSDASDPVLPGDVVTYTLTVENTGNIPLTPADVGVTDDLTEVLDDATYNNDATQGAIFSDPLITWSGALAVGQVVTINYSVTVNDADSLGDGELLNAVTGGDCPDPAITDPDDPDFDPGCVIIDDVEAWTSVKSSDAGDPVLPGDTITYMITVTNTGNVPLAAAEVEIQDDLTGVLDDAVYNNDVDQGATYAAPVITWSDDLAVDEVVTITYTVTVNDADSLGDGELLNAITGGDCPDPAITDPADPDFDPDCVIIEDVEAWTSVKSSNASDPVLPGDDITYTITVTNTGNVPLTAADVEVQDDLTDVLDDAVYNNDVDQGATYSAPVITWSDDLAVDEVVTITYSVTVNDATDLGDGQLLNAITGGDCPDPAITDPTDPAFDPGCVIIEDIEAWTAVKTSDAVGNVEPGGTVNYEITVENTGNVPLTAADVVNVDDLADVLDDATYNNDADDAGHSGTFTFLDPTLTWSGALAVDEVVTITYTVTVNDADQLGDGQLLNAITGSTNCPDPAITDPQDPNFDPDCVNIEDIEAWTAVKTSDAVGNVEPGDQVNYEITVENTGNVPLTAADVVNVDDLAEVLDDAAYNNDADDAGHSGTFTFAAPTLTWSGPLAVDEVVTLTYSVTVNDATSLGDGQLLNAITGSTNCPDPAVTDPTDPAFDPDCVNIEDIEAWTAVKTSDAVGNVEPGDPVNYEITVTNTGNVALTAAEVEIQDDLTDVLDDAVYNNDVDQGATYSAPVITWSDDLAVDEVVTITYSVTVNDADSLGDGQLLNAITGGDCPDPAITDPADPNFDPDCVIIEDVEAWTAVKTSAAPNDPVLPGDVVTYTIEVENTGNVDLTAADVVNVDDLTEVLDDAAYNSDAADGGHSGTFTFTAPTLTWSGALDAGDTVTLTYSVTVNDADQLGDGRLLNAITGSTNCPDPAVTDPSSNDFDPNCVTIEDIEAWTVVKTSDASDPVQPGDIITYTLTVENTGNVDLTDQEVMDDVSDVRDDAVLESELLWQMTAGEAGYNANFEWVHWFNIDLSVDQVATLTYTVTVNDAADLGDGVLLNAVTGGDCPDPAITDPADPDFDPDCVTINEVGGYTVVKTSDATDPVLPGDVITYTVTVENTGGTDLTGADAATFSDDLTDVLDDATYNNNAGADIGTPVFSDPVLSWSGDLLVDEVATVTYSVTVDQPIGGNHNLVNAVTGGDCPDPAVTDPNANGFDPDCVIVTPLPGVDIEKVIFGDPVTQLQPGDTFEYVVTVENIGEVDLVGETFTDDLSEVLDDATLDQASITADIGAATFSDPELTWTGDLLVGEIATVRYSITINDPLTGNGELFNAVVGPIYSNCVPPDPSDPDCFEETPVPNVHVEKVLVGPENPQPGDVATYRITIENRGGATAVDEPITDDLSDVLDDAVYNNDASATSGTVSYSQPTLSWLGDIPAGDTVEITYTVTINGLGDLGNGVLENTVSGGDNCPDDTAACSTEHGLPAYEADKSVVSPAGEPESGDVVTYEVIVTNTGGVPVDAALVTDDLSDVLDDATYNGDAQADSGEVTVDGDTLTWTGPLDVDESVAVTYSVTVNDSGDLGDGDLINILTSPNCPVLSTQDHHEGMPEDCVTVTPIPAVEYVKSIIEPDSGEVRPGGVVTYRVEVFNRGGTDLSGVSFTDDLSDVLEDASYRNDAAASTGTVSYDEPVLTWTGDLAVDGSATVEYSVLVDRELSGNVMLENVVVGDGPSTNCPAASPGATCVSDISVAVDNPLPRTGADIMRLLLIAMALLALGSVLVAAFRRRRTS